ncbi:MAG: glycerophosphodiester phosphodiesterase [Pyrinomonadaceae bacterium]
MFPLIIGHRGASADAPENTLAAFARALSDGADGLEFDVRLARDGVPVVIHDATLKRTGGREDTIASLTSDELRRVDVGSWFNRQHPARARPEYAGEGVPLLSEVLELSGAHSRRLYVELKCDRVGAHALAAATVAVIRAHGALERTVVESFTFAAFSEVKRLAPEIRTAALFERRLIAPAPATTNLISRALAAGADEIALQRTLVTRRAVEAAREAGLPVVVWTVDRSTWAEKALSLGLHALITNHPARMRAALDAVRARF